MRKIEVANKKMLELLRGAGFDPCWKCEYCGHINECNDYRCSICGCPYPEQNLCEFSIEEILYAFIPKAKEVAEQYYAYDQALLETSAGNFIPYIVSDYYYPPYPQKLLKGELSKKDLKNIAHAILYDLFGNKLENIEKEYGKKVRKIFEELINS